MVYTVTQVFIINTRSGHGHASKPSQRLTEAPRAQPSESAEKLHTPPYITQDIIYNCVCVCVIIYLVYYI